MRGKPTEKELGNRSEEFRAVVAEHGKVRLLVRMPEIPSMELGAVAEDLKLAPYATTSSATPSRASKVIEWGQKVEGAFIGGEVRHFEESRYEEAWRWLRS